MAIKKVILSIDGGGIRGIIPGQVLLHTEHLLQEISGDKNRRIADHFDLIAGTSTGGILSCAYLMPNKEQRPKYSASDVVNIYFERGQEIFANTLVHRIKSLGGVLDEKYPAEGLEKALNDYFGDTKLNELLKPSLITAYDIRSRKAKFFTQHDAHKPASNFYVRDITRATASAPGYFQVANIRSMDKKFYPLIDGGVFANNPGMCAYAEVRKASKRDESTVGAAEMAMLSLGTGYTCNSYKYKDAEHWGLAEWMVPLVDIMMSGVSETVDYELMQLFDTTGHPEQYIRINGELKNQDASMDNVAPENFKALERFGNTLFKKNRKKIKDFLEMTWRD
ncbi:MAG: patatin-like phospholipase family protein [Cyclobacteriaceae bacterium]|nr:patatin-like phospholipase family protein [Cyclobacteriaceae bacterium]